MYFLSAASPAITSAPTIRPETLHPCKNSQRLLSPGVITFGKESAHENWAPQEQGIHTGIRGGTGRKIVGQVDPVGREDQQVP
jgi:hypothetical protein